MLVEAVVTGIALVGAIWLAGEIVKDQPALQPVPVRKKHHKK